jgi:cobyrinic acid a,c-diamide synthase
LLPNNPEGQSGIGGHEFHESQFIIFPPKVGTVKKKKERKKTKIIK